MKTTNQILLIQKVELLKALVDDPYNFDEIKLDALFSNPEFCMDDLKTVFLKLFDKNDRKIINNSDAATGYIGKLNRRSQKKRDRKFWKKIKTGKVDKVILAEGDSWFEYPRFIADVIDHLNKRKDYAIKSIAYGGDWLSNILLENEYIEELSLLKPDVFLISGGGNDIVGGYRLAQLVHKRKTMAIGELDLNTHEAKIAFGKMVLNKEFEALMKLFHLQYRLLFKSVLLNDPQKFKGIKIITQGYDYAIPTSRRGFGINVFKALKPVTNMLVDNGKWLDQPLNLMGYFDTPEKNAIVYTMIHRFNEVLIEAGHGFENVFHIDSRGAVDPEKGWYNELHPNSSEFREIARIFEACIDSGEIGRRIYKVQSS